MTFDSFCDKVHHRSYNTYTLHHIDNQWNLQNRVLKTSLMELSHTSQNICNDFNSVVDEYKLNNKKIVCVTDSAPNVVEACRLTGNYRVPCIAHKANTLIQKDMMQHPSLKEIPALLAKIRKGQKMLMYQFEELRQIRDEDNQNQFALLMNEISELDDAVDAENQYVSEDLISDAMQSLDHGQNAFNGLKSLSNIRFGCLYKLSKTYKDNSSIIKKALEKMEKYDLIMNRNELALLDGVVELLDIFNVFTTFMQGKEYTTINTFVLFYTEIVDRLRKTIEFDDNDVITRAAQILLDNMDERLPLTAEFIGAALIDPNMQRLAIIEYWLSLNGMFIIYVLFYAFFFIEIIHFDQHHFYLRTNSFFLFLCFIGKSRIHVMEKILEMFSIDIGQTNHVVHPPSTSFVSSLLNKHIKIDQQQSTLCDELSRFTNLSYSEDSILSFWKKNEANFPKLAKIARVLLCIPMTTAKSEGAFSIAGSLIRKQRASITPFRAEKTLLIHDNYDILKFKKTHRFLHRMHQLVKAKPSI